MNTQRHRLEWVAPAPLWPAGTMPDPATMRQPALLSFKSDQFVSELNAALAQSPPTLPVAAWESAAVPPAGVPRLGSPPWSASRGSPPAPLKLFQPVHGRFYMVAASFVCQQIGLPDHALNVANQERTYFVLRKLDPDGAEMAWVPNPAYPSDPTQFSWQTVKHPRALAANEDLIPLFPVFVPGANPPRRLHAGLIPTSTRDTIAAAPGSGASASPPSSLGAGADPRVLEASARVVEPYAAIVNAFALTAPPQPQDPMLTLLVEASAFLMLDLAEILEKYVPDVFAAIVQPGAPAPTGAAATALLSQLQSAQADTTVGLAGLTWAQALQAAWAAQTTIDTPGPPPASLTSPPFNLYNADQSLAAGILPDPADGAFVSGANYLSALLSNAITAQSQPYDPPDASVATQVVPKVDSNALYVVRCVFQRCALKRQQFGTMFPPILSDPSQAFSLASFFDSDAPARTIRIPMPFDTSPAALRKFPKGVGFLLSPKLQQQIGQVSSLANVVKGQLGNASLGFGEICCFSIQILIIISLILTFMIAIALNFVFWWLPFLKICLPVPNAVIAAAGGSSESESS